MPDKLTLIPHPHSRKRRTAAEHMVGLRTRSKAEQDRALMRNVTQGVSSWVATCEASMMWPITMAKFKGEVGVVVVVVSRSQPLHAIMLSEKAKGKQRALDNSEPTRNIVIRFTEGIPDLTVSLSNSQS